MKRRWMAMIGLCVLGAMLGMQAQTFEQLWKQVEQAEKKGLPQSVIRITEQIYRKGEKEKKAPQMLKAYVWRMQMQGKLTPDSFYVDLKGLEQWAAQSNDAVEQAVLHSLLAEYYADYADYNRWELRNRTNIEGEEPSEDIRLWTASQFAMKVRHHVQAALRDSLMLLQTSSRSYLPWTQIGESSAYYHHDLYHLLSSRALRSYEKMGAVENGQQSAGEYPFGFQKAMDALYQRRIALYQARGPKEACLLSSLAYLQWKRNARFYPEPDFSSRRRWSMEQDPYLKELNRLKEAYSSEEVCAEVFMAQARYATEIRQPFAAKCIAEEGIRRYPHYPRINELKNLMKDIEKPYFSVRVNQQVYPGEEMEIHIAHKNVDGFTIQLWADKKVVKQQWLALTRPKDYLAKDTVLRWLAPEEDRYAMRIVPRPRAEESYREKPLSVSRLEVLTATLPQGQYEVVTLDRKTGHPIPQATVTMYGDQNETISVFTTDAEGRVVFPWNDSYRTVKASKGKDTGMAPSSVYHSRGAFDFSDRKRTQEELTLLTDRSLYRPGQTVYVKGIAYGMQPDTANVLVDKEYTVTLKDANSQEVGRQQVRTNAFGSFATTFTLPAACLNGHFSISAGKGSTVIRVEEYKRPTFDITFEQPTAGYRIGEEVSLKGNIRSFSGVPLADLAVKYSVERVEYAFWRRSASKQIASGEVQADEKGGFVVPVRLEVDEQARRNASVHYQYKVEATVTNVAGETQSAVFSLAAGYRSLVLQTSLKARTCKEDSAGVIKPQPLVFKVDNLNGQPVQVTGQYAVYKAHPETFEVKGERPVLTGSFTSNVHTPVDWSLLPSGAYVLKASVRDAQGQEVLCEQSTILYSLHDQRPPVPVKSWLVERATEFDEAHPAVCYYGTSEKDAYVLMRVFSGDRLLETKSLLLSDTIQCFTYPYQKEYGDGLLIKWAMLRNGVLYQESVELKKRMPAKQLKMKWTVFRDKLRPGQQEEWRLSIRTPQGTGADAEMLGLMYDASLDKIWNRPQQLNLYYSRLLPYFYWMQTYLGMNGFSYWWKVPYLKVPALQYDRFVSSLFHSPSSWETVMIGYAPLKKMSRVGGVMNKMETKVLEAKYVPVMASESVVADVVFEEEMIPLSTGMVLQEKEVEGAGEVLPEASKDVRTNLAETAFFYPQLRTNEQGEVVLAFTMPESLTRWKFCGYAHTQGMLTGNLEEEVTTSKEFMLTPNLPRFVRVGDETTVSASLINQTNRKQQGTVRFVLFDPLTDKVIRSQKQKFVVEAGKSTGVTFGFKVTGQYELLGCRWVADSENFSDGEQQLLPVLSDKMHVVEALPMPIRGEETRTFSLQSLFNQQSKSVANRQLTVEFTGNPAWYAVQALPSLGTPQHHDALSWATAYYAHSLAAFIMNSQPRIKEVFESWKLQGGTKETLWSNLQKNQELKNLLLAESPWVLEAQTEAQQKERLATLFDLNNVRNQQITALTRLQELQQPEGAWSWFKGMKGSPSVTLYIAELNARLAVLTGQPLADGALKLQQKALDYLHQEVLKDYKEIRKARQRGEKPSGVSMFTLRYLYVVALSGQPVPVANKEATAYYLSQIKELLPSASMSAKALAAIVLDKNGRKQEAQAFVASLKEYLTQTDEQGLFFAFNEQPMAWGEWPIRVHVDVMEALTAVGNHAQELEEMKMWLLKQKQTQQWESPVASADAVYALLMRGTNLLDKQGDVRIVMGNEVLETVSPAKTTVPGLGYVKQTYTQKEVVETPVVEVEKRNPGIAWGAVYASYDTPISELNQTNDGWKIVKKWYVEQMENGVTRLLPVTDKTVLHVGDKVVVRLSVYTDRAADFVQLKDQRAACLEPVEQVSGYSWNDGLGKYVDVKDASMNYFFDALGKGVFVLTSAYRVSRTGTYEAGVATLQSAYAPEYAAHSHSMKLKVENR